MAHNLFMLPVQTIPHCQKLSFWSFYLRCLWRTHLLNQSKYHMLRTRIFSGFALPFRAFHFHRLCNFPRHIHPSSSSHNTSNNHSPHTHLQPSHILHCRICKISHKRRDKGLALVLEVGTDSNDQSQQRDQDEAEKNGSEDLNGGKDIGDIPGGL